jgi:hypothetical protein
MLTAPPLSPREIADRGRALYAEKIKNVVESACRGQMLVLDIVSGDYEVDPDEDAACDRIEARRPDGVFYILRVGYPASLFIGASAAP